MSHEFQRAPTFAGYWQIGGPVGLKLARQSRPRWLTRRLCLWLLEWEWFDGPVL